MAGALGPLPAELQANDVVGSALDLGRVSGAAAPASHRHARRRIRRSGISSVAEQHRAAASARAEAERAEAHDVFLRVQAAYQARDLAGLRAITAEMMYALVACVVLAAAFGVFKARMPVLFKGIVAVAAAVVVALMLAIDAKFWGVVVMGGAVIILFFLPWLDYSPVKSIRYRPDWHKYFYAVFVINFLILGYLGVQPPSPIGERVSQVGTLFYFGFFLLMPWWSRIGKTKPVPDRVTYVAH